MAETRNGFLPVVTTALAAACLALTAFAGPKDFTLKPAVGEREFRLSDAKGHYVALHFLLKTECPYCLAYTRDYIKNAASVAGVEHVFIKPDSVEEIRAWAQKLEGSAAPTPIYQDPDAALAKQFDIPDGFSFHGQTVHYPALVVLGPDGNELFRYVGRDNTDRMPFEKFAAKISEVSKGADVAQYNLGKGAVALGGYDPVSYFDGKPAPGDEKRSSVYRGVNYRFANDENRNKFAENPQRYLPAYGGWCATAMAKGDKVEIDPANYQVTNGRLFLFYKGWLGDAKKDWNKDEPKLTRDADEHWSKLAR